MFEFLLKSANGAERSNHAATAAEPSRHRNVATLNSSELRVKVRHRHFPLLRAFSALS